MFASGSTADGCHVIFTDTTNGRNESFNIILPEESKQVLLSTSGIYTITAYDIVNESVYGPAVQYPTIKVIIIPCFSSATKSIGTGKNRHYNKTIFFLLTAIIISTVYSETLISESLTTSGIIINHYY